MKYAILLLFILGTALLPSCCDDDDTSPCSDPGIILGEDPRDCACCGGWFIEIEGDTLRAQTLPEEFVNFLNISDLDFPLPVHLDWEPDATPCLGDEIEVSCIEVM